MPRSERSVWIDVGTAGQSDLLDALLRLTDAELIGIEPIPAFAQANRDWIAAKHLEDRAKIIEAACDVSSGGNSTLLVHPERECSSLLPTSSTHEPVGRRGACLGARAKRLTVRTAALEDVILAHVASRSQRIELLKIDVQGHELPCLLSAGSALRRVDNLFLEVQDVPEEDLMYKRSVTLGRMDMALLRRGFVRQYCEENFGVTIGPPIRELNCLWTRNGSAPIWVAGQMSGRTRRLGRAVGRNANTSRPPHEVLYGYVTRFNTTSEEGAMVDRVRELGLKTHPA
jgi:FkbM family methyltransferase